MKDFWIGLSWIIGAFLFMYFCYWVMKNGSYWLFYESMVQDTIKELVKPEYLRVK